MADRIVVVDGERESCQRVRRCLEQAGYDVLTFSARFGIEELLVAQPSLILISAVLPNGSGLAVCKQIRRHGRLGSTPILILTAGTGEDQSCAALEAGADSCLAKPFSSRELLAWVKSALRRCVRSFPVEASDILIDHSAMKLSVRGTEVVTTTLEFRLIDYFARHRGRALTRDVLLDAVWGETQFVTPRSVDACIRRLREKIEPDVNTPSYLKTVRGIGYRFDAVVVWPNPQKDCNCPACAPSHARVAETKSLARFAGQG